MTAPTHLFRLRLEALLVASLAGCDTVPASPSPQFPSHVVSGIVSETVDGVARRLASQPLFLLIRQDRRSYSLFVRTDQNGRYTAEVPNSRVFVYASGTLQPCLASATVTADTTIDVQVVSPGRSFTPPPNANPLVSGVVYETTAEGRVPLRGATVWLDASQDAYLAHAETDEAGRFVLCRVDVPMRLDVFADGLQPYQHSELIRGTGDVLFEFEFRR